MALTQLSFCFDLGKGASLDPQGLCELLWARKMKTAPRTLTTYVALYSILRVARPPSERPPPTIWKSEDPKEESPKEVQVQLVIADSAVAFASDP